MSHDAISADGLSAWPWHCPWIPAYIPAYCTGLPGHHEIKGQQQRRDCILGGSGLEFAQFSLGKTLRCTEIGGNRCTTIAIEVPRFWWSTSGLTVKFLSAKRNCGHRNAIASAIPQARSSNNRMAADSGIHYSFLSAVDYTLSASYILCRYTGWDLLHYWKARCTC